MAAQSSVSRPDATPTGPGEPGAANPWLQAYAYGLDAWQHSVLYLDVMRQRGN